MGTTIAPAGIKYQEDVDMEKVLFSPEALNLRISELGRQISTDFAGKPVVLLGVATGAFLFLADLARAISLPVQIDFVKAASYGVGTTSSGAVAITKDTALDLVGQNVIVVEDIIDTGHTLNKLVKHLSHKAPASVSVCALLNKEARRVVDIEYPPGGKEYIGFPCPDEFVVGYGLDFAEKYRSLPYVGILKPEVFS